MATNRTLVQTPRLAQLRKDALMSQQELARAAEVGKNTIHRLENGGTAFPETARKLAKALGVDIRNLL